MAGHGGKRPGAGRKPGGKNRATKEAKATLGDLARQHTGDAIKALVRVMNDTEQSGSAVVAAANSLLDRGYGKPIQAVEHSGQDGEPMPFTGFVIERAKPDPSGSD